MTIDSSTGEIILNREASNSKDYGNLNGKRVDMRLINCERTHYLRWHNQRFNELNGSSLEHLNMVAENNDQYK